MHLDRFMDVDRLLAFVIVGSGFGRVVAFEIVGEEAVQGWEGWRHRRELRSERNGPNGLVFEGANPWVCAGMMLLDTSHF